MLGGRQVAWLIRDHFKITETNDAFVEFIDLLNVELKGDNLVAFQNDWDMTIQGIADPTDPQILEALYKKQLDKSVQMKEKVDLDDDGITLGIHGKDYDRFHKKVNAHLGKKRTRKNPDLMDKDKGRGFVGTEAGDCKQFLKNGKCSRGDSCHFGHQYNKLPAKAKANAKPKPKREDRGRSHSRDGGKGKGCDKTPRDRPKSRGKSPSGKTDRPVCGYWLLDKCTNGDKCDFWHSPFCSRWKKGECKA